MKKFTEFVSENAEYLWIGGEIFVILIIWENTNSIFLVLAIKLLSILLSEQIFHEEIEGRVKRVSWNILSFLGYVIAFSLTHSGYFSYGVLLSVYIALMGALLLRMGCFHPSHKEII